MYEYIYFLMLLFCIIPLMDDVNSLLLNASHLCLSKLLFYPKSITTTTTTTTNNNNMQ